ncbi:LOW QUALITY PROTEIN: coiled-coil domain-containing protein 54 [Rhynchonycteris naso]
MCKLQTKMVKATAGKMWTSNITKIRQSLKHVYHKLETAPYLTRNLTMITYGGDQDNISTMENNVIVIVMLQDVTTAQTDHLSKVSSDFKISAVLKIQGKTDIYQKQMEVLEIIINVNKGKQCSITKSIFFMKENIDVLKEKYNIYIYSNFSMGIKLIIVHGGKWRFLFNATKLGEFMQWLLSRPTIPPEELKTQRYCPFIGPIESLSTICLSAFDYIYCLFGFSKEVVTRL